MHLLSKVCMWLAGYPYARVPDVRAQCTAGLRCDQCVDICMRQIGVVWSDARDTSIDRSQVQDASSMDGWLAVRGGPSVSTRGICDQQLLCNLHNVTRN